MFASCGTQSKLSFTILFSLNQPRTLVALISMDYLFPLSWFLFIWTRWNPSFRQVICLFLPKMISLLAFLSPFWIIGTWLFDMVAEASAYGFVNFRSTLWNNRWLLCLLRTSFFSLFCVFGSFGSFEDAEAPDRLCVDRVYACPYIKEVVFELDSAGLVYSGLY